MSKEKKVKSTLGDRMNDFYFEVEDSSGKSKGVMDGTKAAKRKSDNQQKS